MSDVIRIIDLEETSIVEVVDFRAMTDDELDLAVASGSEEAIEEYLRRNPDIVGDIVE